MSSEIRFTVFCLENYKQHRSLTGKATAQLFHDYDVFGYLRDFYDVLHTTGSEYIVQDIDEYLKARGCAL